MKPLGIVATHSPIATTILEHELKEQFRMRFGDAPPLPLIINAQHGHSIEMAVRRHDVAAVIRLTTSAMRQCEAAGAEGVVFGSSVLHVASPDSSNHPVLLDLADAALDDVATFDSVKVIGLIGTRLEEEDNYWNAKASQHGLGIRVPDRAGRDVLVSIFRQQLVAGTVPESARTAILQLCAELQKQGADVLMSVVPEMKSILRPQETALPVIHALEGQVTRAITWSTGVPVAHP